MVKGFRMKVTYLILALGEVYSGRVTQKDDRAAHGIDIIIGKTELANWLNYHTKKNKISLEIQYI